jgi:valyl-tRNA synthetase
MMFCDIQFCYNIQTMEKNYDPKLIEETLYAWWEKSGYFQPRGNGEPFSVVIPPPNVTGVLHIGHALNHTLQDIIVRQKRMQGYKVCWMPGSDHAGIATQNVVEKQLKKDKVSRHDLGREGFLEKVWDWKSQYGSRITEQIRKMGQSVDWSRERFTMDEGCQEAVLDHFIGLYEAGHIYRGKRIINWCPRCHTALSDIEVNHKDINGHLWHIAYKAEDGTEIVVATTRPETMFGDTAVAVHPEDERYQHLIGKTVRLPLTGRDIPIVADEHVEKDFGTGAVKVTPAHDPNDFEIGQRHDLERILVMDESGIMNENAPADYQGLDRFKCRKVLIAQLETDGNLVKIDDHAISRGECYRCNTVVEPYLSNQWFVAMKELAGPAIEAVQSGQINFHPKGRWEKLYFEWMNNIRDWCISRQIWWGHRIPVYYRKDNPDEYIVSKTPPADIENYIQDEDVLDTWFSSSLWPFSTFGWPKETDDLKDFYPTALLITGYDIITFWVSRMITMGIHEMKEIPFKDVYIHGLVRDIDGRKMSKSIGNAIDPLDLVEQYGADAMRFGLSSLATLGGQDMKLAEDKIESSRNFANKIWNVTRYLFMVLDDVSAPIKPSDALKSENPIDQWVISKLHGTIQEVNASYLEFNYAKSSDLLWDFVWNQFCDWYIEASKIRKEEAASTLAYGLVTALKLLHPSMPFVTDHIWQELQKHPKITLDETVDSISISQWPELDTKRINPDLEETIDTLIDIIRETRKLRKESNIALSKTCNLILIPDSESKKLALESDIPLIQKLAKVDQVTFLSATDETPSQCAASVTNQTQLLIPLEGLIDLGEEKARLEKQLTALENDYMIQSKKLSNPGFVDKAPEAVVAKVKEKADQTQTEINLLKQQIEQLSTAA